MATQPSLDQLLLACGCMPLMLSVHNMSMCHVCMPAFRTTRRNSVPALLLHALNIPQKISRAQAGAVERVPQVVSCMGFLHVTAQLTPGTQVDSVAQLCS